MHLYLLWNRDRHRQEGQNSNFHRKLHSDKPSFTVGKDEHYSSGRFYHWKEPRRLLDIELMRIGSFPDEFIFIGDSKTIHKRIGNSVPPLFMKAIAEHIRDEILVKVDMTGQEPELVNS